MGEWLGAVDEVVLLDSNRLTLDYVSPIPLLAIDDFVFPSVLRQGAWRLSPAAPALLRSGAEREELRSCRVKGAAAPRSNDALHAVMRGSR